MPTSTVRGPSSDMVDVQTVMLITVAVVSYRRSMAVRTRSRSRRVRATDGRVRGNADSQIDGDLSGRRKRLRLARLRSAAPSFSGSYLLSATAGSGLRGRRSRRWYVG